VSTETAERPKTFPKEPPAAPKKPVPPPLDPIAVGMRERVKAIQQRVEVGMDVLFYPLGDTAAAPFPAKVAEVGEKALTLSYLDHGRMPNQWRRADGVMYVDDPAATANVVTAPDCGKWAFPTWLFNLLFGKGKE
jgi:hypothetical protein